MVNVTAAVPVISLEDAKGFLRVDHDLEDGLISALVLAATQGAETRLKRPIIEREGEETPAVAANAAGVPESIKQWVRMQTAHMYERREAASADAVHELPFLDGLLDAWRHYE